MSGRPGRMQVAPIIMKEFTDRPGQVVYLSELMERLGPHARKASVQNAVRIMAQDGFLEVKVHGNAWVYNPNGTEKKRVVQHRVFEEVGPVKDGAIIVECEDGTLWRATQM